MRVSELPNELVDRGIYWQIGGFAVFAMASVTILAEFAGSEHRAYLYFEIAVTRLYWAIAIPLAGLFEGVRRLFERMSDIRAKRRRRWLEEGRAEGISVGRRQERERVRQELERLGVALSPEVRDIFDEPDDSGR